MSDFGSFFNTLRRGDVFRFDWPTFVSFTLIFLTFNSTAQAATDLSVGGNLRSYPLSALTNVDLGLSTVLWGSASASPWYGYSRLEFSGATVGIFSSGQATAEFFPLSFLGARAGGESMQNDRDYAAFDCETLQCRGRFYRTFAETELTLGAGRVFVRGRWRRERWTQKNSLDQPDFIDPASGLVMTGSGDSQTVYHGTIGVRVAPRYAVVAGLRYAENQNRELSRFPFAMIRYSGETFSAGVGGGLFESAIKPQGGSLVAFVRWDIWPSPALH